jgi:hypothetical protein
LEPLAKHRVTSDTPSAGRSTDQTNVVICFLKLIFILPLKDNPDLDGIALPFVMAHDRAEQAQRCQLER